MKRELRHNGFEWNNIKFSAFDMPYNTFHEIHMGRIYCDELRCYVDVKEIIPGTFIYLARSSITNAFSMSWKDSPQRALDDLAHEIYKDKVIIERMVEFGKNVKRT